MKPLFLGSHPALDFLNTRLTPQGAPIELIGDGPSYAAWLEAARLLHGHDRIEAEASLRRGGVGRDCRPGERSTGVGP